MKKIFVVGLLLFAICISVQAQATWQWARSITGTGYVSSNCICSDDDNYSYISGHFSGTMVIGLDTLTALNNDTFIAKISTTVNGNGQ